MALRIVSIGSGQEVHQFDDLDFDEGIYTDAPIWCATPTKDDHALRYIDIPNGLPFPVTSLTVLDDPYTATIDEYFINCDCTGGNINITLPTAIGQRGKTFVITKTDASANTVIVDAFGVETINGSLTHTITSQYETLMINSDGANWLLGAASVVHTHDHGSLTGLGDDDHLGYFWLLGRAGGIDGYGSPNSGDDLRFFSNASNDGLIKLGTKFEHDENTGYLTHWQTRIKTDQGFFGKPWFELEQTTITAVDNDEVVGVISPSAVAAGAAPTGMIFVGHTATSFNGAFGLFGRSDTDAAVDSAVIIIDGRKAPAAGSDWNSGAGSAVSNRDLLQVSNRGVKKFRVGPTGSTLINAGGFLGVGRAAYPTIAAIEAECNTTTKVGLALWGDAGQQADMIRIYDSLGNIHNKFSLPGAASSENVFNEQGGDLDNRFETLNVINALFIDASLNSVDTNTARKKKEVRITSVDSPYTVLATDHIIFADTDGGAIEVDLPVGVSGRELRIMNVGSSGNNVTVDPNGAEQIYAGGAGVAFTMFDSESILIHYNSTEGWW